MSGVAIGGRVDRSQTLAVLSSPVMACRPSGVNATLATAPLCPSRGGTTGLTLDRSHTRAVLSAEPVTTRRPSGLNATLVTAPLCPTSEVETGVAPDRSHTRAVLSAE